MIQYVGGNQANPDYNTVAASQTTQKLSNTQAGGTGAVGDYLAGLIIVPATATPGAVTVFDGATAVLSIPAGTTISSYYLPVGAYSRSGSWNITTGASVSVVAVGQFT
jgi:hypothetical protein